MAEAGPELHLAWAPLPVAGGAEAAAAAVCGLGESPFWHPDEGALYWIDIPGQALHRWHGASRAHRRWTLPSEPGCIAPLAGGDLLVAARDGLFRFNPGSGSCERLAAPPYDPRRQRFNDGRADPQGRLWVATLSDARIAEAALWRWDGTRFERRHEGLVVGNGIAFAPDGLTMWLSDTGAHRVHRFAFDGTEGSISAATPFAAMTPKPADGDLAAYRGRPDGAAVDIEGAYWSAQFEGARLVRLGPGGALLAEVALPLRCPTMPCFGGAGLRTLFVTTARKGRSAEELARTPWAGQVLMAQAPVAGLPVAFARG